MINQSLFSYHNHTKLVTRFNGCLCFKQLMCYQRTKYLTDYNGLLQFLDERGSIFRMPFKSKLNLSRWSNREESQISTIQQQASASVHHTREQDYATMQKNENLKRMIHEKLKNRNSVSLPDLPKASSPKAYRELSVDEYSDAQSNANEVEGTSLAVFKKMHDKREDLTDLQPINDKIFKRVKFEEVNELEETVFEAQDALYEEDFNSHKRADSWDSSNENLDKEAELESEVAETIYYVENAAATPYFVEEFELPPPTPMKRKSRENSFSYSAPDTEPSDAEPPVVKPRRLIQRKTSDIERIEENLQIAVQSNSSEEKELETRTVKEALEDVREDFHQEIEFSHTVDIEPDFKAQTIEDNLPHEDELENLSQIKIQTLADSKTRELEISTPLVELHAPKSILKSSETTAAPKSITFQNEPETIYHSAQSSITSSSSFSDLLSDEDEDVWSQVDRHRFHLTRNQSDIPPPLPKTPPPSVEDEKQFSFA